MQPSVNSSVTYTFADEQETSLYKQVRLVRFHRYSVRHSKALLLIIIPFTFLDWWQTQSLRWLKVNGGRNAPWNEMAASSMAHRTKTYRHSSSVLEKCVFLTPIPLRSIVSALLFISVSFILPNPNKIWSRSFLRFLPVSALSAANLFFIIAAAPPKAHSDKAPLQFKSELLNKIRW